MGFAGGRAERGGAESQPQQRSEFNAPKPFGKPSGWPPALRLVSDTAALRNIG
jgi:hypothetical protein